MMKAPQVTSLSHFLSLTTHAPGSEDDGNILMLKLHRTDTLVQNAYATQVGV